MATAVRQALGEAGLPDAEPTFERPRQREHGDWSTNVALALAKRAGVPPRQVAQRLVAKLPALHGIIAVEVAGPGFVNFRLSHDVLEQVVRDAASRGQMWGRYVPERSPGRIQVEFVSANPTGPLHIGAGRWAAVGDAMANLFELTGWGVSREYYFNDAGEQMERFGASVQSALEGRPPPDDGYRGGYIQELAEEILAAGETDDLAEAAYQRMLHRIEATLARFRVHFDSYFGERTLHESGAIRRVIDRLVQEGHAYELDGALWLRTTAFGDDKDRVLRRSDGRTTYFAADCAYMANKLERGFDRCIYLLGADHHGYVGRLKAIALAEGLDVERIEIIIGQLVNFLRGGKAVRMSKRSGEFVTLDDLINEVGTDAARYTFLRTSIDVTLDFDLAEVVKADRENPVYYVQYSSARIAGIMRKATERGVEPGTVDDARLELLTHESEAELIRRIAAYPETVRYAAAERAPHKIARYAEELAEAFHRFYTECQVVSDDGELTVARYWLCMATRRTLVNALGILGVSAPDRM
ncbi:MAG: arginine--tRNA ligase [Nitriliruptorales bacterium]|nr:arginine--tRNA ligase [Nitriliruptorales bacterium]